MEKLCIIVPAHNEEERIGKMLSSYSHYFENLRKKKIIDYALLIVINDSTDRTEEIVRSLKKRNSRVLYINIQERGKGNAIIQGFNLALKSDYSLIGFVDADLATPPKSFYDLVLSIQDNDGAMANRHSPNSVIYSKGNNFRKFLSKVMLFIVNFLFNFNYSDTQCGAKLFTRSALKKITPLLKEKGWIFDIDLLYQSKILKLKIKEVPTIWYEVKGSKLNPFKDSFIMLKDIILYRIKN